MEAVGELGEMIGFVVGCQDDLSACGDEIAYQREYALAPGGIETGSGGSPSSR